jgi:hypothetical protein
MRTKPAIAYIVLLSATLALGNAYASDKNYLITRTGVYSLLSKSNEGRRFEQDAADVINLEYEFHRQTGMSFGGEYLRFSNPYTLSDTQYTAYSQFVMGNIKQYFAHTDSFSSFLGAGAGIGSVDTREGKTSVGSNNHSGPVFQLKGGVMYRLSQLALYAEVRQVSAKIISDIGSRDNIDLSGRGVFAGFAFIF